MPECHKCKYNGASARVRQKHCTRCAGPSETNNHGKSFVSIDSTDTPDVILRHSIPKGEPMKSGAAAIPEGVEDYLRRLLAVFEQLTDDQMLLVKWLLCPAHTLDGYAQRTSQSRQKVWARYQAMTKRFPVLKAVASDRVGNGHGGRKRSNDTKSLKQGLLDL